MSHWLDLNAFLGISGTRWLYAVIATIVSYFVLTGLLQFLAARLEALSRRTSRPLQDIAAQMLLNTRRLTRLVAALLIGSNFLGLPAIWDARLQHLWFLAIGLQLAMWGDLGIRLWIQKRMAAETLSHNPVLTTMSGWVLRALLWAILVLAILANMGVNITAFVASLGVGGVAVALAVQSILADLFASLAIGLDKPFEIGDYVTFGDGSGTIEHIGLKTTRIRSLGGEEIVCGNTDLLKKTIHNYKRMSQRRVAIDFGVTFDATTAQLREIPGMMQRIIEAAPNARFDSAYFLGIGDTSFKFEAVYYIPDASYSMYMDAHQPINLQLIDELRQLGVALAYPTQTVHLAQGFTPATKYINDPPPIETEPASTAGPSRAASASIASQ